MMRSLWPNMRSHAHAWLPGRRMAIALAVLVLLGLAHPVILRLLARPLVADDSNAACDCFCIHGDELGADGYEPFETAAQWRREQGGRTILLLLPHESRVVEIGAVRSFEQTCRNELAKRRIPSADIDAVHCDALNIWEEARGFSAWLKGHPDATVRFACCPMGSGRLRYVFNKALGPDDARRVHLATLPDPSFSADDWWQSRTGVKAFMYSWLDLAYAWAYPDSPHPYPSDARTFQDEVRARIGRAP
jgi:hypothetical protein